MALRAGGRGFVERYSLLSVPLKSVRRSNDGGRGRNKERLRRFLTRECRFPDRRAQDSRARDLSHHGTGLRCLSQQPVCERRPLAGIRQPRVPGHELVGVVNELGAEGTRGKNGQRVCAAGTAGRRTRGSLQLATADNERYVIAPVDALAAFSIIRIRIMLKSFT